VPVGACSCILYKGLLSAAVAARRSSSLTSIV
jgi:hypothetical protein